MRRHYSPALTPLKAGQTLDLQQARSLTNTQPDQLLGWQALGNILLETSRYSEACDSLEVALQHFPDNIELQVLAGHAAFKARKFTLARHLAECILQRQPEHVEALLQMVRVLHEENRLDEALVSVEKAISLDPENIDGLELKAYLRLSQGHFDDALERYESLTEKAPERFSLWQNSASLLYPLGQFSKSDANYRKAIALAGNNHSPFSARIFTLHYNPEISREDLQAACLEWSRIHSQANPHGRARPADTDPQRRLRVGILSHGLRMHPVGWMTASTFAELPKDVFEIHAYSSNPVQDALTRYLKLAISHWSDISQKSDEQLYEKIIEDRIDILVDMTGHSEGSRMTAISMEPAPLIVKWVGGLINTTGVSAIDYLLTDNYETPAGEDSFYVEKLIRLPDDYICFTPPPHAPAVGSLPAERNGYITLGCFNNSAKVNDQLLEQWGILMQELPNARLLLKSSQYSRHRLRERILGIMAGHGISPERIQFEEASPHAELLETYNRVDIALDTWPYSGGLTTCEALLMGVPVVTLPGPTFAGRHSATHLINAGMPELVTSDWGEYRARVRDLAGDLDCLATMRRHLRQLLKKSPVCDAPRFARNLSHALRAIWQRYCEGRKPAALSIDQDGQAWFADDKQPMALTLPAERTTENNFEFNFEGKIITMDHGALLLSDPGFADLQALDTFVTIAFDPRSSLKSVEHLQKDSELHYYPHVALGNGAESTLYACLDPVMSGTLEPLPADQQLPGNREATQLIAKLPITTLRLDDIEGLDNIDWLLLDNMNDSLTILENGEKTLAETLLVQVRVNFSPTHKNQPELTQISHWLARHGFSFYRLNNLNHFSHLPQREGLNTHQATQLHYADALFVPNTKRMASLTNKQLLKTAFVLHSVYGIQDLAYRLIDEAAPEAAERYLKDQNLVVNASLAAPLQEQSHSKDTFINALTKSTADTENKNISEEISLLQQSSYVRHEIDVHEISLKNHPEISVENAMQEVEKITLDDMIHVVDIGANPIDGIPPYAGLLREGTVRLVGFEPQTDALQKLNKMKGPNEKYLPHAVGDGQAAKLYLCQAQGMTSTLKPNNAVLDHFQGYPLWGRVIKKIDIKTIRLDDVNEIEKIDWLKIDIQGGELAVFRNGVQKLRNALVIQTEVNFIPLYESQPLFAEIDQWMRSHGFMLHALLEQRRRLYAPLTINNNIYDGINQLTTADAVYVRDINSLASLSRCQCMKMAKILYSAYGSIDLAYKIMATSERVEDSLSNSIDRILKN